MRARVMGLWFVLIALSGSLAAQAAVTVTPMGAGGVPLPTLPGFSAIATFNSITQTPYGSVDPTGNFIDGGGSWSGNGIVMNNPGEPTLGLYAEPYNDTSNYMAVVGHKSETVTYGQTYDELGLYWGSIDAYNEIKLYNGGSSMSVPMPLVENGDEDFSPVKQIFRSYGI